MDEEKRRARLRGGRGRARGISRRRETRSSLRSPRLLVTQCGGRNALDSDLVVGGGVGPRRGLEAARLVPHDQRFSISRSPRGSTGRISDAANDENVRTATGACISMGRKGVVMYARDNADNWDSLSPFPKVAGQRETARGKIRRALTTSNFLAGRAQRPTK